MSLVPAVQVKIGACEVAALADFLQLHCGGKFYYSHNKTLRFYKSACVNSQERSCVGFSSSVPLNMSHIFYCNFLCFREWLAATTSGCKLVAFNQRWAYVCGCSKGSRLVSEHGGLPNTELTVSSRALDRVRLLVLRLVVWLLVFRTSPAAQTSRREKVASCVGCWFEIKT